MVERKRHPAALPFLFLTEMWERFGFYVVQGMLVLYMTKAFGFSDDRSYTVSGVFIALAYIAPMIGGFLADKVLGYRKAIVWGGFLLSFGYALLALWEQGFYLALGTIIVGNGLFKPNISSLLGALYAPGDTARDTGFTIFYVGINLGVLLAGVSSGVIQEKYGWQAGFGLASIGLLIGLSIFATGMKLTSMKYPASLTLANRRWLSTPHLFTYFFTAIIIMSFLLQSEFLGKWLLPMIGIGLIFFVFRLAYQQDPFYRNNLIILNILIISAIVYWMLFLQLFTSANLFIDRLVDKTIFGIHVPTTVFYTLEAVFVILLGPLFAWSWQTLSQNQCNPSPIFKFMLGILFAGFSFATLGISTYLPNAAGTIPPMWIVLSYFLLTIGEMLLSPIGLSAVTLLSPPHLTGMMMGIWFVALGFGGEFAGWLAKLSNVPETDQSIATILPIYRNAFFDYAYIAFGVTLILFIVFLFIKRTMKDHPI